MSAAGEADDLAVLQNRVAFLDWPHRELVPHADRDGDSNGRAIEGNVGIRRRSACGQTAMLSCGRR